MRGALQHTFLVRQADAAGDGGAGVAAETIRQMREDLRHLCGLECAPHGRPFPI